MLGNHRHLSRWLSESALVQQTDVWSLLLISVMFGFLTERHSHYTVHGGWSLNPEQMYLGFSRNSSTNLSESG